MGPGKEEHYILGLKAISCSMPIWLSLEGPFLSENQDLGLPRFVIHAWEGPVAWARPWAKWHKWSWVLRYSFHFHSQFYLSWGSLRCMQAALATTSMPSSIISWPCYHSLHCMLYALDPQDPKGPKHLKGGRKDMLKLLFCLAQQCRHGVCPEGDRMH